MRIRSGFSALTTDSSFGFSCCRAAAAEARAAGRAAAAAAAAVTADACKNARLLLLLRLFDICTFSLRAPVHGFGAILHSDNARRVARAYAISVYARFSAWRMAISAGE